MNWLTFETDGEYSLGKQSAQAGSSTLLIDGLTGTLDVGYFDSSSTFIPYPDSPVTASTVVAHGKGINWGIKLSGITAPVKISTQPQ